MKRCSWSDGYATTPIAFNRYSYALNNPLSISDPDGNNPILIGALIGGTINWITNGAQFNDKGFDYFCIGALSGAVGAGVTGGISSMLAGSASQGGGFMAGFLGTSSISSTGFAMGFVSGASGGIASGMISGTGNSLIEGHQFGFSLHHGLNESLFTGLIGGVLGGVASGIDASLNGRNFWTGDAITYNVDQTLMASTEGGVSNPIPDGTTVINSDTHDIYYKPEDGKYGASNIIPPGKSIKLDADGIATSNSTNMVFKIPGKYGFRPLALVKYKGDVALYWTAASKAALSMKQFVDPHYVYGWLRFDQLDESWKKLFELAKSIK